MEVTSALLVEEVRKHEDGRVDLLGLFEDIYVADVPFILDNLSLFLDIELAPEDRGKKHVLEARLQDADGAPVQPARIIRFDIPDEDAYPRPTAQLDLIFPNVPFTRFGAHHLDVILDGKTARRVYLSVQPQSPDSSD